MNTICPRGVYQLLLAPCLAISFVGPVNASSDYDFLKIHPSAVTIFQRDNLPNLVLTNKHSLEYVKMYTAHGKVHTSAMLGRGMYYFPIYERHLSAQQMPLELKYLSMVESELRTDVESPSAAVGLWQFISSTAKHYGLRQNEWCDERRDPEAATLAAVKYLKDLYAEFGNWELVPTIVALDVCAARYTGLSRMTLLKYANIYPFKPRLIWPNFMQQPTSPIFLKRTTFRQKFLLH